MPDVHPKMADVIVHSSHGDAGPLPFHVILPPRIYIQNNLTDTTLMADSVTVMTFDPPTGAASQLGSAVSIGMPSSGYGGCNHSIGLNEKARQLYVSGNTGMAVFDIDPVMGTLTPTTYSPIITGGGASSGQGIAVTADGSRVFMAHYPSKVVVYDVSPAGMVAPVAGSPFMVLSTAQDSVVVSHDGRFVYGNNENHFLAAYSVAANGALTDLPGSPYATGFYSFAFNIRPGNDQIFLPFGSTLGEWQPGADGVPAQIVGSPFTAPSANGGPGFTVDGNRVYIPSFGSSSVSGYSLAADGTPTALPGSPYSFPTVLGTASCAAVSRDGAYLVVTDTGHKRVGVFTLAADGTPTPTAGSPVPFVATESVSGVAITF